MERLKGHVALVTGGGRGLGRAISNRLHAEGAELAICGTSSDVLEETAEALGNNGRSIFWQQCEITDSASIKKLIDAIVERFGKVDILVNNAAVAMGEFGAERVVRRFDEIEDEVWDRTMEVNLKAPWKLAKAVYPYMAKQQWGRIINIGSSTVYYGRGTGLAYIASKAGLIGLTRVLANEMGADNITVNTVSVGLTMTDRIKEIGWQERAETLMRLGSLQRLKMPEDTSGTVAYLASDDASFVTGQAISVDGGRSMH